MLPASTVVYLPRIIIMDLIDVYHTVSSLESFAVRAARGNRGNLRLSGDSWLIKRDKPGEYGVAWEYQVYTHLQRQQLALAPLCELESGVFDHPDSICLRLISNGETLRDYIEAYLDGLIPADPLISLMELTSKLLADFWEAGYTHRDLHPRNIVVGLNSEGTAWQPYIIDFSSSTHEEQLEEYCYAEGLILAEMATQADDWEVLQEELWALVDEPPEDFTQLMHALALELPF
jgi:hypothetical protein